MDLRHRGIKSFGKPGYSCNLIATGGHNHLIRREVAHACANLEDTGLVTCQAEHADTFMEGRLKYLGVGFEVLNDLFLFHEPMRVITWIIKAGKFALPV